MTTRGADELISKLSTGEDLAGGWQGPDELPLKQVNNTQPQTHIQTQAGKEQRERNRTPAQKDTRTVTLATYNTLSKHPVTLILQSGTLFISTKRIKRDLLQHHHVAYQSSKTIFVFMKAMCHNFMCTACWEYTRFSYFLLLLLGMATVEHLPPCQPCLSNFISKLLNLGWPSNENINTFSSASCLSVSATIS